MPDIPVPQSSNLHLTVGTSGIVQPYSYYIGTELAGCDIELARRFAAWLGAELEFKVYDYGAIVPACATGDVDCVMANLNITPERAEALPFSDVLYEEKIGVMVRGAEPLSTADGMRIGVQTGSSFDAMVAELMPEATIKYFNTKADLVAALTGHKIDAFLVDEPVAKLLSKEDDRITWLPDTLDSYEFGAVFPMDEEGEALRDQFNAFLDQLPEGELERLSDKWLGEDEAAKTMPDIDALRAENGTLRLATESGYAPFEYVRDGAVVGLDMELAAMFCEYAGYGLEIVDMNFEGILPAVTAGKADFAVSGLTITPERSESVLFSAPYYSGGTVLAVLVDGLAAADADPADDGEDPGKTSFLGSVQSSFYKTFIRELRYKLFIAGINTTLLITLLSILLGTALGFAIFMLCRNGNPVANRVTRASLWLVQGMPMVVLLMILYYVIFGSVAIGGIAVAVIGFTLTFGASVFGLLRMGVGAVDIGQYEAAYALGYSNGRTFFRIILPQAMPHVLPGYKGEVVGLIKATAIVGYIAVQDLTKMGDIVRSRTYEAFFPLIAVTIIYFVLEGLIGFIISRISLSFNPKRRKPGDILKGVQTDDQN